MTDPAPNEEALKVAKNIDPGARRAWLERCAIALDAYAAERVSRERAWRPISEYPRDAEGWGPNVLLFVPSGVVAPASDYRILTGRLEAEMWLDWGTDGCMGDIQGEPTYWQPLPSPPDTGIET